jgi:leucyl-tRNA synthetase
MEKYNPRKIEKKWQTLWQKDKIYKTKDCVTGKKNFYHLVMFPYPSGDLHIGHWYNFAPADVFARMKRMQGYNVMSPIGFDAFGLPAENAALKHGIHPKSWTYKNIKRMTKQLKSMGNAFDWSRQIITSDPDYYKWTQWMFLQLYKNGLAYKKRAPANWCSKCHTVLANEQVLEGKCERCGTIVVRRDIEQWLFRITKYAARLIKDLRGLDWPERTKLMQKNWIGESRGVLVKFEVLSRRNGAANKHAKVRRFINVFTTRVDTIFGCTYCVVAPEHSMILKLKSQILNWKEVRAYITRAKKKSEIDRTSEKKAKTGVKLKGLLAVNPFNGVAVPIFVADYVLGHYGTGAVMAVPAHDERDFVFAKNNGLPIKIVVWPTRSVPKRFSLREPYTEDGILLNSGPFTGMKSEKARERMANWLRKNKLGGRRKQYRLHDWLVSRQRYWGAPIPIVYCEKCGVVAVPEKDLPVFLPNVKNYYPTEDGRSPLAHSRNFVNATCPRCGRPAKRETDTMDTFVCSSWYYLRFADPKNKKRFAGSEKLKAWLPVDMYVGGAEHGVLHLLYSRFFAKVLKDLGFIEFDEPFLRLRHQGVILGADGYKMSKSRGNVVDPDKLVESFGSDSVRLYLCFMGDYSEGGPWNSRGIMGVRRFLDRSWRLQAKISRSPAKTKEAKTLESLLHKTIKKVTEDIENFKFNTALSQLMILLNRFEALKKIDVSDFKIFVKLLAPFAPHLTEELWRCLGERSSVHLQKWPTFDPLKIEEGTVDLVVQINGRFRGTIAVSRGIEKGKAEALVFSKEKFQKYLGKKRAKRIVFIKGRLINIVV